MKRYIYMYSQIVFIYTEFILLITDNAKKIRLRKYVTIYRLKMNVQIMPIEMKVRVSSFLRIVNAETYLR